MESTQLAEAASDTTDPRNGLRAVMSLRLLVESLEFRQVEAALRAGLSWGHLRGAAALVFLVSVDHDDCRSL